MSTATKTAPIVHITRADARWGVAVCGVHYRSGVKFADPYTRPTCPKCLKAAPPERLAQITARYEAKQAEMAQQRGRESLYAAQGRAHADRRNAKDTLAELVVAHEGELAALADALIAQSSAAPEAVAMLGEILDHIRAYNDATVRLNEATAAREGY